MHHRILMIGLLCGLSWSGSAVVSTLAQALVSHRDESLDYPIRVLEAEAYWQPAGEWAYDSPLTTLGAMRELHRELGTLSAQRVRLPVPDSPWKLTGRVVQTEDGTIYAAFGHYLYWSRDEGRSWEGKALTDLPGATHQPASVAAFGSDGKSLFVAHDHRGLPPIQESNERSEDSAPSYPMVISRSQDRGRTWMANSPLQHPFKLTGGDGNHIVGLGNGELLAGLDGYGGSVDPRVPEKGGLLIFRSPDHGVHWQLDTYLPEVAETGFLHLGGRRLLAAFRAEPDDIDQKTVRLANSEDGGRTWHSHRPLSLIYGQAHGDLAALPEGGVLATYENRYPYAEGGAMYARVSWDQGQTWEPQLYKLTQGHGYPSSVVMRDGAIITVAGDGQLNRVGQPTGRGYTLQALRWKPWPK